MTWYVARIILYAEFIDTKQDFYPVMEEVILLNAESVDEAWEKAELKGKQEADSGQFNWDDKRAEWRFAGVRRLSTGPDYFNPDPVPGPLQEWYKEYGIEIDYSVFTVKDMDSVKKLVDNEAVEIVYESGFGSIDE